MSSMPRSIRITAHAWERINEEEIEEEYVLAGIEKAEGMGLGRRAMSVDRVSILGYTKADPMKPCMIVMLLRGDKVFSVFTEPYVPKRRTPCLHSISHGYSAKHPDKKSRS
jgi:hypothetical protein